MYNGLENIWSQINEKYRSVRIEDNEVIYKGIKVVRSSDGIRVYSTGSEFYDDVTEFFRGRDFDDAIRDFLRNKYVGILDSIERSIQQEISDGKNYKRFNYLKKIRDTYLNKYNEINS